MDNWISFLEDTVFNIKFVFSSVEIDHNVVESEKSESQHS